MVSEVLAQLTPSHAVPEGHPQSLQQVSPVSQKASPQTRGLGQSSSLSQERSQILSLLLHEGIRSCTQSLVKGDRLSLVLVLLSSQSAGVLQVMQSLSLRVLQELMCFGQQPSLFLQ